MLSGRPILQSSMTRIRVLNFIGVRERLDMYGRFMKMYIRNYSITHKHTFHGEKKKKAAEQEIHMQYEQVVLGTWKIERPTTNKLEYSH